MQYIKKQEPELTEEQKILIVDTIRQNTGLEFNVQKKCIYLQTKHLKQFNKLLIDYSESFKSIRYKIRKDEL